MSEERLVRRLTPAEISALSIASIASLVPPLGLLTLPVLLYVSYASKRCAQWGEAAKRWLAFATFLSAMGAAYSIARIALAWLAPR